MPQAPELSLEGIVQFAIRIEEESKAFYEEALKIQLARDPAEPDHQVVDLLSRLVKDEIGHRQRLMDRYKVLPAPAGEFEDAALSEAIERIVKVSELQMGADAVDILATAYSREIATRDLYTTLLALSQLADLYELFEELAKQEQGHANRIQALLNRLTGA